MPAPNSAVAMPTITLLTERSRRMNRIPSVRSRNGSRQSSLPSALLSSLTSRRGIGIEAISDAETTNVAASTAKAIPVFDPKAPSTWVTSEMPAKIEKAADPTGSVPYAATRLRLLARTSTFFGTRFGMLPGLFGVAAGVFADRFNRKVTMVVCDAGRALLAVSLVFVHTLPQLFVVSFAMEVLALFWGPSREASIPNLVPKKVLVRANSLSLVAAYGTLPVGSAAFSIFAGISEVTHVLGAFGSNTGIAFAVDAATFVVSASLIASIPIPRLEVSEDRRAEGKLDWRLPFRDLTEGIRFILRERSVRSVIVGIATALFGAGIFFALGQPFSSSVLKAGSSGFGILITALGSGVGLGMIVLSAVGRTNYRRDTVFAVSLLVTGLTITTAALSRTVTGAAFWALLAGVGAGSSYVMGFTHLHEQVTDELRGRTFAALYTLARTALLISISA